MNASYSVQALNSTSLLAQFAQNRASGWLQVSSPTASWSFYLEQGRLTYASDSLSPLRRLDRHLRNLSSQVPNLVSAVRVKLRLQFAVPPTAPVFPGQDYQAICWLVNQQHLSAFQAAQLIEALVKEIITTFKTAEVDSYRFIERRELGDYPQFCQLELSALTNEPPLFDRSPEPAPASTVTRFRKPQRQNQPVAKASPPSVHANSRPPLAKQSPSTSPSSQASCLVRSTETGSVNFNSVNAIRNQFSGDSRLPVQPGENSSLWASKTVPFSPDRITVDLVPANSASIHASSDSVAALSPLKVGTLLSPPAPAAVPAPAAAAPSPTSPDYPTLRRTYTIVCVDDSPVILRAVESFLDNQSFAVVTVSDPVKALIEIVSHKTDLVLLDITMPKLNGYELCAMLRKHPGFRKTPIVMVTSSAGMIDRAKARLVGASGYLTKPFNQSDLIKMIFKHLGA